MAEKRDETGNTFSSFLDKVRVFGDGFQDDEPLQPGQVKPGTSPSQPVQRVTPSASQGVVPPPKVQSDAANKADSNDQPRRAQPSRIRPAGNPPPPQKPPSNTAASGGKSIWGRSWDWFQNIAILFSLLMNLLLIAGGVLLWRQYQANKEILNVVQTLPETEIQPLVKGISDGFEAMNSSTITTTIPINEIVPISLDIPVQQTTVIQLTEPILLNDLPVTVRLLGEAGTINGITDITLPEGTLLPIALDMNIQVTDSIQVAFPVDVAIPISDTELSEGLIGIQKSFDDHLDDPLAELTGNEEVIPEDE